MTSNTSGPSAATQSRVHAALMEATPLTTTELASRVSLSAATVRKALTALKEDGLAVQSDEDRTWLRAPEAAAPADEPKAAKRAAKSAKATAAVKATKQAEAEPELTGAAAELQQLGYPRRTAEIDGAVLDLIRSSGPLTAEQVKAKLDHVPDWSFRRLAEGKHGDLTFPAKISAFGKGKDRAYSARTESVTVAK